jgi:hypothetical protein
MMSQLAKCALMRDSIKEQDVHDIETRAGEVNRKIAMASGYSTNEDSEIRHLAGNPD